MTRRDDQPGGEPLGGDAPRWLEQDRALVRLEDVLASLPLERAVPDLRDVLAAAGVTEQVLLDERAAKLLREALLARPFGTLADVERVRVEVELLTLEVEVLTERLADAATDPELVARAAARLPEVRARLDEVHGQL
jgi:hypothetical protein